MDERDDKDNARMISDGSLGIFTVLAVIFLLWGYLWFKGTGILGATQTINILFHEVAQLNDNADVFLDGIRVGMVDKILWLNERHVLVRIQITNRKVVIPQGATYRILTNGIVGAKYIEIDVPHPPDIRAGLPALPDEAEVEGLDPARPELAINKLVIALSNVDPQKLVKNYEEDRIRLVRAADQLSILAIKTMPVVDNALPLERDLTEIAHDLKKVSRKVSNLLDDPNFTNDLKITTTKLKETAESVQTTVRDINSTLKDKALRQDLLSALKNLNDATEHVQNSVSAVEKMSKDLKLRTDVKDILLQARKTLDKVDALFSRPSFGSDLKETLTSTRAAIGHLDAVARQLNQILDKRAPIMHLMFGRPGQLKDPKINDPKSKDSKPKESKQKNKQPLAPDSEPVQSIAPAEQLERIEQTQQPEQTRQTTESGESGAQEQSEINPELK
jgi:ABC-type transporter Mla subunit MlaD